MCIMVVSLWVFFMCFFVKWVKQPAFLSEIRSDFLNISVAIFFCKQEKLIFVSRRAISGNRSKFQRTPIGKADGFDLQYYQNVSHKVFLKTSRNKLLYRAAVIQFRQVRLSRHRRILFYKI